MSSYSFWLLDGQSLEAGHHLSFQPFQSVELGVKLFNPALVLASFQLLFLLKDKQCYLFAIGSSQGIRLDLQRLVYYSLFDGLTCSMRNDILALTVSSRVISELSSRELTISASSLRVRGEG